MTAPAATIDPGAAPPGPRRRLLRRLVARPDRAVRAPHHRGLRRARADPGAPRRAAPDRSTATGGGASSRPRSSTRSAPTSSGADILNLTVHGRASRWSSACWRRRSRSSSAASSASSVGSSGAGSTRVLMRITDFFLVLPTFVLALILAPIIRGRARQRVVGVPRHPGDAPRRSSSSSASRAGRRPRGSSGARRCRSRSARSSIGLGSSAPVGGAHHVRPHPAERREPDRRERRARLRGRRPDRDDALVRRSRRPVPAVVGPAPQRGRGGRAPRASARGGTSCRRARASCSWSSRSRSWAARSTILLNPRRRRADDCPASARAPDVSGSREAARGGQSVGITAPRRDPAEARGPGAPLLVVEDLATCFSRASGRCRRSTGVSFRLDDGEALGIAGESGCGKTTTALSLVRLLPANGRIVSGSVSLMGIDLVPKSENGCAAIGGARSASCSRAR